MERSKDELVKLIYVYKQKFFGIFATPNILNKACERQWRSQKFSLEGAWNFWSTFNDIHRIHRSHQCDTLMA